MNGTHRLLAVALALAAAACAVLGAAPAPDAHVPLRATLRRAEPRRSAPAWIEDVVCSRGAELGARCSAVAAAIAEESAAAGLDPLRVLAIIGVESGWDPDAVSPMAAHGLMQLQRPTLEDEARGGALPSTDPDDPLVNVRAGIRYYGKLLRRFQDPDLALVAYNAGPEWLAAMVVSEQGLPEWTWEYPRRVHREERLLRTRLDFRPAEARARLAVR